MATFITSKSVGETLDFTVTTSTGFWKYNHNGVDSGVYPQNKQLKTVTNANGEFTIISCDGGGNVSGDVTSLGLYDNLLTSFDGTGLSSLTYLHLGTNQLTSFDGTGLSSLTELYLTTNQITSFDGTGLSGLTALELSGNQLTSFDGTGLSGLTYLALNTNQLTSFDSTGLSGLTNLDLGNNQLTSFDGPFTGLISLNLDSNQLTSFDLTGLTSLIQLTLSSNQLTSSINDQILNQLNQNGLSGIPYTSPEFYSTGGRTSASNTDYDNLISLGWYFEGLDLIAVGNGKLRVKGVNSGI